MLLEVATWNGVNILRTSRQLGLRSEASNRFEKQLHPELAIRGPAGRLAADGRAVRGEAGSRHDRRGRRAAAAAEARVCGPGGPRRCWGCRSSRSDCVTYLERLGFGVERDGGDLVAEVPVHRHYDVTREVDLVEEVGRIHGYDEHLPATLPQAPARAGA